MQVQVCYAVVCQQVCVCQHVCVPGVHVQRNNYERLCFNRVVLQIENVENSCIVCITITKWNKET